MVDEYDTIANIFGLLILERDSEIAIQKIEIMEALLKHAKMSLQNQKES